MKTALSACLALAAACAASGASAQNLKPGLWEVQHKMKGNPEMERQLEEARRQMAAMPPEQRKQMEAVLAGQGVQMAVGGQNVRMCLTREMVERNEIPAQQGDCKVTNQQRTGNSLKVAFSCTNPPSSGESRMTINSPESYAMTTTATSSIDGRVEKMSVEGTGRWLGADCGNLRPPAGNGK
jgi:hypothetical protein